MNKTVLITGASSGIGRASALRLAREGFVVFAGVRKPQDAESLTHEAGPARERLVPVELDVTDANAVRAVAAQVRARVGDRGLDGLVNNAGIGVSMPVEYLPLEVLRHQFEVNVFGQVAVTQAFLPLIRQARGRIVNIGSVGGHITIPFGGALCGSKHAFRSLNDALRLELHPFGIHVCMIEPGSIRTPAVDKTLGDVEGVIARLPPEGVARYGEMLREFTRRAAEREQGGSSPDVVAAAVQHALTADHPHARYPVGKHARALVTMPRILPDGLLDRVRFRLFGISPRFGAANVT